MNNVNQHSLRAIAINCLSRKDSTWFSALRRRFESTMSILRSEMTVSPEVTDDMIFKGLIFKVSQTWAVASEIRVLDFLCVAQSKWREFAYSLLISVLFDLSDGLRQAKKSSRETIIQTAEISCDYHRLITSLFWLWSEALTFARRLLAAVERISY